MTVHALLGAVGAATGAAQSRDLFDAPWMGYDTTVYPQGFVSWGSRMADFNGDGFADLAVVSWYSNSKLTILLADGRGGFTPPIYYDRLLGALDVAAADMDGDGDIDLVVPNSGQTWQGSTFSLYLNDGDGSFYEAGQYACGAGPNGITVGDFNRDGHMDVAVAHDHYISFAHTFAIVLADGFGGFMAPQIISIDTGTNRIAAGDIDRDSDIDLVIGHKTNKVTVMYNVNGLFVLTAVLPGITPTGISQYPTVKLADIDRDGDLDILYSHTGSGGDQSAIALYRNPGGGIFGAAEALHMATGSQGAVDLAIGDVTGDTWPDIIAPAEASQSWSLLRGDGSGRFLVAEEFHCGEDPISAQLGNVDGAGGLDVVIVGRDSLESCVYRNPGNGAFVQPPVIEMVDPADAPVSSSNLAVADIDGDGDLDLVVGYSANFLDAWGVSVRRNNGDGTFAPREDYPTAAMPLLIKLRDVSGDGFPDLIWIDEVFAQQVHAWINNGDGTFGLIVDGPELDGEPWSLDAADVDGDGDQDLLVGMGIDEVGVSRNSNGAFAAFQIRAVTFTPNALATGDFDHDGHIDLLCASGEQGYVEVCLGNGNGTFRAPTTLTTGRDVRAIAVGDLDHDNNLDFAAAFNLDGTGLTTRRGLGNGTFDTSHEYHGATSATYDNVFAIAVADVDGDGDPDALAPFFGAQEVCFWRGHGDGTFDDAVRYGVGQQAKDLHFGDFTGDGAGDLAVLCEPNSPATGWYYPGVILLRGRAPATILAGDLNCDGVFNNFDIDPFVLALVDPAGYEAAYPACSINHGDVNHDGAMNNFDIEPFVGCLLNGGCP